MVYMNATYTLYSIICCFTAEIHAKLKIILSTDDNLLSYTMKHYNINSILYNMMI